MAIFHLIRSQTGPEWQESKPMERQTLWPEHAAYMNAGVETGFFLLGGPLPNRRVAIAVDAPDEDAVRTELARDPWHESHLLVESIEPWTIRLRSPLLGDRV